MHFNQHRLPKTENIWEQMLWGEFRDRAEGRADLSHPLDAKGLEKKLGRLKKGNWSRESIYKWLDSELRAFDKSEKQKNNLQRILNPESVFVTTGQQPGLLGGPVLWLHKALTAVSLAKYIEDTTGTPAIPLFWIAGDDSDLKECNYAYFPEAKGVTIQNFLQFENNAANIPVDLRFFPGNLDEWITNLSKIWGEETLGLVRQCLQPGDSFTTSFKKIFQAFLSDTGMLVANGCNSKFRDLSSGFMSKIISGALEFSQQFDKRKAEFQNLNLPLQIDYPANIVHAFHFSENERFRLYVNDTGGIYSSKGKWSVEEIMELHHSRQNSFLTHDAVSRPLLLESCLPTAAHVLGPHELGYFQQLNNVFGEFNGDIPLALPRCRVTMLSKKFVREMEGWGYFLESLGDLTPSSFLKGASQYFWDKLPEAEKNHLLECLKPIKMATRDQVKLDYIKKYPGLQNILGNYLGKTQKLREMYLDKCKRQILRDRAPEIHELIIELNWLGRGKGQDRVLNVFSMVNLMGLDNYKNALKLPHYLERKLQWILFENKVLF